MFLDQVAKVRVDMIEERLADEFDGRARAEKSYGGRVGEDDNVVGSNEHRVRAGLDQAAIAFFAFAERLLGLGALSFLGSFLERAIDGWTEAGEAIFEEVIIGAGMEGVDRDVFTDFARNDDERNFLAGFLEDLEGGHTPKARNDVIGYDQIPLLASEFGSHTLGVLDQGVGGVVTCPF